MPPSPDNATGSDDALAALQRAIRACRLCVAAGHIPSAAPILRGNRGARLMVVGQAPAVGAAERPLPYSGATGVTLRGWLERAGFPADALYDPERFYLTSVTKCFPGKATSGGGDRLPSRAEVALCGAHLAAELRLVQPELLLALGRLSIETLVPSTRGRALAELVGTPRPAEHPAAGPALVLPLPHPSGVSRWLNAPEHRALVERGLAWLGEERGLRGW